jgi:hypothetical protein
MHPCLHIPELVEAIISPWLRHEYPTLKALAVTCRIFHGPASDLIWADLPSLVPLIKCLPVHLWEERENNWSRDQENEDSDRFPQWPGRESSTKLVSLPHQLLAVLTL